MFPFLFSRTGCTLHVVTGHTLTSYWLNRNILGRPITATQRAKRTSIERRPSTKSMLHLLGVLAASHRAGQAWIFDHYCRTQVSESLLIIHARYRWWLGDKSHGDRAYELRLCALLPILQTHVIRVLFLKNLTMMVCISVPFLTLSPNVFRLDHLSKHVVTVPLHASLQMSSANEMNIFSVIT